MNNITYSFSQFILVLGFSCILMGCSSIKQPFIQRFNNIQEPNLKTTLKQAFTRMGGLENWEKIKSLTFRKKTLLYTEKGAIEKSSDQWHQYEYLPNKKVQISWEEDQVTHLIEMQGQQLLKKVNDEIDQTANKTSLKNSVEAATFVIGVPFKLMDEGVTLKYEGTQQMLNGKQVHVVKANYHPQQFSTHSKSDIWWHYFDVNTYQQLGYKIQIHDHNSYIENLAFEEVNGFLFITERKSWRVDEQGEKLYLRAEYVYSDFTVE